MTIPTAPPSVPPTAPPPAAGAATTPTTASLRAERFFLWVAGLGVARSDGWLGGVAAGVAARLRIDPLIVRGVLVVAALFGLPVIFLYAVAWALLPDSEGRIHARDLLNRAFDPVQLGILGTAIVGLIPTAPLAGRLFGLGYDSWSTLSALSWIVGLVLAGILLFLIVRAARRTPGASASRTTVASVDSAAPGASDTLGGSGTAEGADVNSSDAASAAAPQDAVADPNSLDPNALDPNAADPNAVAPHSAPPAPPAPLAEGPHTPEDLAAWRAQHAAWKEQDQAWRRQQQDAERAARDQLRRERQEVAAAFSAEAAERRRIRRASNPRASFAYVASVIGLALALGAFVALAGGTSAGALGLLVAALVLAVGMIMAGLLRRRSGFLAFVTALVLAGGVTAGGFSAVDDLTFGWTYLSNDAPDHVRQPFGSLAVDMRTQDGSPPPFVIEKGQGDTSITVQPGVELDLQATVGSGTITWERRDQSSQRLLDSGTWSGTTTPDGGRSVTETAAAEGTPIITRQTVTLTQDDGDVEITIYEAREEQE